MTVFGAVTAEDVGGYIQALVTVYSLLIVAYVITSLILSLGVRMPYNTVLNGLLGFLRDVSEPYLRPFRKIIPMIGPLDISPIVALLVLSIGGGLIADAVKSL
ncbi:MAG: YggT family protein [Solirubrobacteraceae bacterium]